MRGRLFLASLVVLGGGITPTLARADPPAMKERNEHPRLEVRSVDDRFSLAVGGFFQVRYSLSARTLFEGENGTESTRSEAPDRSAFTSPRTRVYFFGHVHSPDVRYRLMLGTTPRTPVHQVQLLDAYVEYKVGRALRLRGGRFKIPVLREWVESARVLASVERSAVVQLFLPGRNYGLMLSGELSDIEYAAGALTGVGAADPAASHQTTAFAGRVVWNLRGLAIDGEVDFESSSPRFAVGGSAMTVTRPAATGAPAQLREDLAGIDVALRAHGFDLTAEGMARSQTVEGGRSRVVGAYLRADQYLSKSRTSVGARASRVHGVDDATVSRTELELDAGFYPAQHDLKLVMNLGRAKLQAPRAWETFLMVQVQAGF